MCDESEGAITGRYSTIIDSEFSHFILSLPGPEVTRSWRGFPTFFTVFLTYWYLIATDDKLIPPPAQRFMSERAGATVVEVAGSHAIYVSQPNSVAALITRAATGAKAAS
jgi:hypothetical protein